VLFYFIVSRENHSHSNILSHFPESWSSYFSRKQAYIAFSYHIWGPTVSTSCLVVVERKKRISPRDTEAASGLRRKQVASPKVGNWSDYDCRVGRTSLQNTWC